MYISDPLREALYCHADTGIAFLHVPKAAGSAVYRAVRQKNAVLSLPVVAGSHRPGCTCRSAECRARARHERAFLSRLESGRPWMLYLGHLRLTAHEAADLPEAMPIVVPMRDSPDRLVSYFRFYWTMTEAARHSRVLVTRRQALTWMPVPGVPRANIPRFSRDPREVADVQVFQQLPATYVEDDGHTIRWKQWLEDALRPGSSPFLYDDLLPDLRSPNDPRWSKLVPMAVPDLVTWVEERFGTLTPHHNVSRTTSSRFDLEQAAVSVAEVAPDLVRADAVLWHRLLSRCRRPR